MVKPLKNTIYLLNRLKKYSWKKKIIVLVCIFLLVAYICCIPKTLFDVPYSTVVNDKNGDLIGARIASDEQWRFPSSGILPDKLKTCFIEFEDQYFQYHWGINPLATGRALIQNIKAGKISSGGSTLTMQTIRLSRKKSRTVYEKIIEMIMATRLEFRFSKNQILNLYASHAPFGGNVVGYDAASWRYFGHSAGQLSWAEAATLAVLPNAPSMLHLSRNRDVLLKKRNRLLHKLLKREFISPSEYELALDEPLPSEPLPLPQTAPHLVDYFFKQNPGKQHHSTLNKELQIKTEILLERWNNIFRDKGIRNMAAIVLDVKTNEVIVYCGNVRYQDKHSGNEVDIIRSSRSTGSILKPFLYYAMLNEGEILPHSLIQDIPLNISGFAPQNFNREYDGAVPASEALIRSLNTPFVQMLRKHSEAKFYMFLKQHGIASLPNPPGHYGLSLILGGAESTLAEITTGYANMSRSLQGLPPAHLSLNTDEPKRTPLKVSFEANAAWQTFEALKEVNRPEQIDWKSLPSMQKIAWKTGTSYGFRDAWAVGVTPQYVVGVWVGNASGEGKPELTGARTAGPVLFDIFDMLPSSTWFTMPSENLIPAEICKASGYLKGRFCTDTKTEYICTNGQKTIPCPFHILISLSEDEKYRVYENCAGKGGIIQKSWFVLPPAWEWYYKQRNPQYKSLPPFKAGCGEDALNPMQFIYPRQNTRIYLPKQMDGTRGDINFELAHSNRNTTVYWHLDNDYIGETRIFHKLPLSPSYGKHIITVVDSDGNTLSCTIWVE